MRTSAVWRAGALLGAFLSASLSNLPTSAQETGEAVFRSKCAMCHGPDGAGKTKMGETLKIPDLRSADVQRRTDAELTLAVAKGKNKMPAYDTKLGKDDIAKVIVFVRELGKKH